MQASALPNPRPDAPPARTRLLVGWVVLLGILAGVGAGAALGQARSRGTPEGWRRVATPAHYVGPNRLGELALVSDAWALQFNEALTTGAPADALTVEVVLDPLGRLIVAPRGRDGLGDALVLARGEAPRGVRRQAGRATPLACAGELPAVGQAPYRLTVESVAGGFEARVGDAALRCPSTDTGGAPWVQAGIRRVHLRELVAAGVAAPGPIRPWERGGIVLLGGALVGLLAWVERKVVPIRTQAVVLSPLLLALLWAGRDFAALLEAFRQQPVPVPGALVGIGVALLVKLVHTCVWLSAHPAGGRAAWAFAAAAGLPGLAAVALGPGTRTLPAALAVGAAVPAGAWLAQRVLLGERREIRPLGIVAVGVSAGLALLATPLEHPIARVLAAVAGGLFGLLVWVQVNGGRVRAYNVASLVLAAGLLGVAELGVRYTALGFGWDARGAMGAGGIATLIERFQALDRAAFSTYPKDFPVAYGPRTRPVRIVALGGSSTGGASQNDDIAQFYPARLESLLGPKVEVVNQGAGGWDTFHIRKYATSYLADLKPDIVTVYVGVNEQTPAPLDEEALYARYLAGQLNTAASPLEALRLFNGLRFFLRYLKGESDVAVPPAHTEANLGTLAELTRAQGARLLLLAEASQAPTTGDAAVWSAMERVASAHPDVAFHNAAAALSPDSPELFLDYNHLSAAGHDRLAAEIAAVLRERRWVEATP